MSRIVFIFALSVICQLSIAEDFVRFKGSDANIRQEASTSSPRLVWNGDMLDWSDNKAKTSYHEMKGAVVEALQETDGWTQVMVFNRTPGFVSSSLVEKVEPIELTKELFERIVLQGNNPAFRSLKWLEDDYFLLSEHGGEGSQEIRYGLFSEGMIYLKGNPQKVYTEKSGSGFSIKKNGEDPYDYYTVTYGDNYKKSEGYFMDLKKISDTDASKIVGLFANRIEYVRFYFEPAAGNKPMNFVSVDIDARIDGDDPGYSDAFEAYLSDSNGDYTNVRKEPNGEILTRIPTSKEMQFSLLSKGNGWWSILSYWDPSADETGENSTYDSLVGGVVHYSCLGVSTRNFGNQGCVLRKEPKKDSRGVFRFMDEMLLRPKMISDDLDWVFVETTDKRHSGWIEREMLCGNPVTTCP